LCWRPAKHPCNALPESLELAAVALTRKCIVKRSRVSLDFIYNLQKELKDGYRAWMKTHHPDITGKREPLNLEATQWMNATQENTNLIIA
jgi:hypothetical protein